MPVRLGLPSPQHLNQALWHRRPVPGDGLRACRRRHSVCGRDRKRRQQLPARGLRQRCADRAPAGAAGAAPTHGGNCALRFARQPARRTKAPIASSTSTIAGLIDHVAPERTEKLSQRFALLASQGGSVFELARQSAARSGHRRRRALRVRRRRPHAGSAHGEESGTSPTPKTAWRALPPKPARSRPGWALPPL